MTGSYRSFRADFLNLVKLQPRRVAIVDLRRGCEFDYAALAELMTRFHRLFTQHGLLPRGCVLAMLSNSVEMLVAFFAAAQAGVDFAPLAPDATVRDVATAIRLLRPGLCLVSDTVVDATAPILQGIAAEIVVVVQDAKFAWLPAHGDPMPAATQAGRLYLSTSGTTGEPRPLVVDTERLWSAGVAFARHHRFLDSDARFLNILPMSYLGGLFNLGIIPLACGGSMVIDEAFSGRTFLNFWQMVEANDVTVLWLVPTIVRGLLALHQRINRTRGSKKGHGVRACFIGTAPIDLATKRAFEVAFDIPLLENMALSETTFFTSETLTDSGLHRTEGSVGEVVPWVELCFVPLVDEDVPSGTPTLTEIHVRTPFLFLGYLKPDGNVELPIDGEGFFSTGDLGHIEGGKLVLDGRRRDIIKKGGQLVHLRELEVLAETHPAVAEAAAIGVPHDYYGETSELYLRPAANANAAMADEVSAWLRQNLARYKWPERVLAVEDFPRTASGKIRKQLLK